MPTVNAPHSNDTKLIQLLTNAFVSPTGEFSGRKAPHSVSLVTVALPKSSKAHLKHHLEPHNSLQLQEGWLGQLCEVKSLVRSGWNTENKSQKTSEHTDGFTVKTGPLS